MITLLIINLTIKFSPYLSLHLVPDRLVTNGALIVLSGLIIVLLQGLLKRRLNRVLEVSGVTEDRADEHHDEESQDDGEVSSEQALALLHGSATSEEGDEDDQSGDDDHDVDSRTVEG